MIYSRLGVLCLLFATPLALAQEETRTGTLGPAPRIPPTKITNWSELERLGHYPTGYKYSLSGSVTDGSFLVRTMSLVSPDGKKTLTLKRFEGTVPVRMSEAAEPTLVAVRRDVERTIEANPVSRLEDYLQTEVRSGGPGSFKVRGWTIDTKVGSDLTRTLLLDGIEVETRRPTRVTWAERVHDKGVLIESTGSVQLTIKKRYIKARRQPVRRGAAGAIPQ